MDLRKYRWRINPDKAVSDNLVSHRIIHNDNSLINISQIMNSICSVKYPN